MELIAQRGGLGEPALPNLESAVFCALPLRLFGCTPYLQLSLKKPKLPL